MEGNEAGLSYGEPGPDRSGRVPTDLSSERGKWLLPRVLFLTTPEEDYLQDQIAYGLRRLLGTDCIELPRKEVLYASCPRPKSELYGRGFTLWKHLPEIAIDRDAFEGPDALDRVDLLLFGNVRRQGDAMDHWLGERQAHRRIRVAFLDGSDRQRIHRPALCYGPYFKRERVIWSSCFTRPISFSIPAGKIEPEVLPQKTRLFATHVQCETAYELESIRRECQPDYAFADEASYRHDLQTSRFAITMKKAGWDCMRHYEIAANGCVPCFFELGRKPRASAPFGLRDLYNCIAFRSSHELEQKTQQVLVEKRYDALARNALSWARHYSCEAVAARMLASLGA